MRRHRKPKVNLGECALPRCSNKLLGKRIDALFCSPECRAENSRRLAADRAGSTTGTNKRTEAHSDLPTLRPAAFWGGLRSLSQRVARAEHDRLASVRGR